MAIVQFHQVSLCVRDLDAAARFYRDLLGCRQAAELAFSGEVACAALGVAPGALRAVLLERDGLRLELLSFGRDEPDPQAEERAAAALRPADAPGLSHLTFLVDDLRSTLRSLRDRGVAIDEATLVEHATGAASCLVRDPEGWPVLLVQQPAGVTSPYGPAPAPPSAAAAAGSGASPGEGSR